jgi:hypothetical protein
LTLDRRRCFPKFRWHSWARSRYPSLLRGRSHNFRLHQLLAHCSKWRDDWHKRLLHDYLSWRGIRRLLQHREKNCASELLFTLKLTRYGISSAGQKKWGVMWN